MSYVVQRREEERERRRRDILATADRLYAERGWEAVTMDQIARSARLSRALLYVYFRDKDDVLLALSADALRGLARRFAAAAASHVLGIDKVSAIGRAYVAWAIEIPHMFDACARFQARKTVASESDDPSALTDNLKSCEGAGDAVLGEVAAAVAHGLADGSIDPAVGDPALFAVTLWGLTHGVIQIALSKASDLGRLGISAEALHDNAFHVLRRAMTRQP